VRKGLTKAYKKVGCRCCRIATASQKYILLFATQSVRKVNFPSSIGSSNNNFLKETPWQQPQRKLPLKKPPLKKLHQRKKSLQKKVVAKKAPAKKAAVKRTPNAAFMKPMVPDAALAAVIGATPVPRTEIVKQLWVYIKKHGLQDATNKRNINADAKLKVLFDGKAQVSMFQLAGLIGKHAK
jgi:chromatin remodeling complex protein RSC6